MLIRREVFEKVSLLEEGVFMYYEDFDLCLRTRHAGFEVAVLPEAEITHFENASGEKKFSIEREVINLESLVFFYKKHYSPGHLPFLKLGLALEAFLRLCLLSVLKGKNDFYNDRYNSYSLVLKKLFSKKQL